MNWDGIRYIFQIPLKWFEAIHKRVFNAYGTNFLTVRKGYYGGTEIGIDTQGFSDAVALLGYGKVKTVDGNEPDENGNVELSDVVKSVNGELPDANGDVDLGDIVNSVNGELPDENGDVDLGDIVHTVNGTAPDANGNVQISIPQQSVRTVDHKSPDQQGNIQLNAISTINGHNGDSVGNFAGVVTSVNNTAPDANGNVDIDAVQSVNGEIPDANGNVEIDVVSTVDGHLPDANGAISFGLASDKWVQTDSNGHLTTANTTPVTLPSGTTGRSGLVTFVTGLAWNGTQLVASRITITFTNGVATSYTIPAEQTINTVAYTP